MHELQNKMAKATASHEALIKAKQEAAGKEVTKAKEIASTHDKKEQT